MSGLLQEFIQRMDNRYSVDSAEMSTGDWVTENTYLRGRPFSFDRYPFQKQIVDDLHPNMDVVKPSQIGLTECQVRKALAFITRNRGVSLIFTLPTDAMFERISKGRILPLVNEQRVFNLDTGVLSRPTRSKDMIQVGTSYMYVTGAKESDATSISADAVFTDEVDLTNQQMLALFNSRLQNSDWKINQRFSTPTFHGFGVDAGFQSSDQHEYMCKCDACGHWNIPTFLPQFVDIPGLPDIELTEIEEHLIDDGIINLRDAEVVCEKCRAPLDLGRTENREWVPRFASRTHARGYRVSPFSTNRLSVEYIVTQMFKYRQRDFMRGWYNTVLGLPYNAGSARLSDAEILPCFAATSDVPPVDRRAPTWLGVDIGKTCHLLISQGDSLEAQKVVSFETVASENLKERVAEILDTYNVIGGACDRHPYTPLVEDIRDMSNGRVLPVEYRGQKDVNLVLDPITQEVTHGQVNRTWMIDAFVKMVRLKRIQFTGYGSQKQLILDQLKDMVRDEQPEKPATWVKLTGNDHYFHAGAFLSAAISMKEFETGKYGESRGTVAVGGADFGEAVDSIFPIGKRQNYTGLG